MRVMDDYHVVEDAELIRELLRLTADQFEKAAGVTRMALYRWASGESVSNEESLATLYDFAYSKGIRPLIKSKLNSIVKSMTRKDTSRFFTAQLTV